VTQQRDMWYYLHLFIYC